MIINGDALTVLKRMDSEIVHCAVTSSPYYGLRSYGTEPQIWDGDSNCEHEWGTVHPPGYRSSDTKPGPLQSEGNKNRENLKSDICSKCDAWKGELGQEPTPELFIKHLTTIFHELKRVLRNDGIFWANIGDSYASGKGTCFNPGGNENSLQKDCKESGGLPLDRGNKSTLAKSNLKPKDLIGIPWMLAFSLRADGAASPQTMHTVEKIRSALLDDYDTWNDVPKNTKRTIEDLDEEWMKAQKGGWYLRADLPWVKRNSLPSSVTDRPCSSIEHVFLFSKSKKYFYDHVATMQPSSESYNKDKRPRGKLRQTVNENSKYPDEGQFKKQDGTGNPTVTGFNARYKEGRERYESRVTEPGMNGQNYGHCGDRADGLRFMRDSDFFFKTWQGLLHNEDGEPMALVVNPRGYKGCHFAAFPIKLVEPLILAGTSEHGVCPHCGSPWVRNIKKTSTTAHDGKTACDYEAGSAANGLALLRQPARENGEEYSTTIQTTGWSPSCSCLNNIPVPATVLDPFNGSGATGVACKWHGRRYVGIELNPKYCDLAHERIKSGK